MGGSGESALSTREQTVSTLPRQNENPTPQMATENREANESVYSALITGIVRDTQESGRYCAVFGKETPTEDQRIVVLIKSTAVAPIRGRPVFTILSREGPKALIIKNDQAEKLKALVDNQIKLANEDPATLEVTTGGGLVKDSSGSKLLFGNPNDPSSVAATGTLILDKETFLSSLTESRKAAKNPYRKKYERETPPPNEAQQILNAFNALISQPASPLTQHVQ